MTDKFDSDNIIIFGTQKEYAWDDWQKAFDAGAHLPDHQAFLTWWDNTALTTRWNDLRGMMEAAWIMGVQDRTTQTGHGFNSWWQEIIDTQPVVVQAP